MKKLIFAVALLVAVFSIFGIYRSYYIAGKNRYVKRIAIEVARHGERSPEPYYDLVNGPNFQVGFKDITEVGARSCYALGMEVMELAGLSLKKKYDPQEVYVLSTFKNRAKDSALAQLMGMYNDQFEFPLPENHRYDIGSKPQEDDYILRADDDSCPRMAQIEKALEDHPNTKALFSRIDAWLEANFFPRLRQLTGMPDADTETMYDVVDYIDWARKNGLHLKLDLTDEDLRLIRVADEAGNYEDYAANPDQKMVATWEIQQLYIEVSQIIQGQLAIQEAPILSRYFPQSKDAHTLPKLILLSGHASNVTPLLELFNVHILDNPPPASSIWVNYYVCETCHNRDESFKVEVLFCADPRD